jgi:hypothetical protein
MGDLSRYEFSMFSDPKALNFGQEGHPEYSVTLRAYNRIFFKDSIFSFYPYAEVFFRDSDGKISDNLFFIEGLELKTKLGYPEKKDDQGNIIGGYLEHDYVWSENQINNIVMAPHVSGDTIFMLISKYALKDHPKSRSFNYNGSSKKTIEQIIKDEVIKDWQLKGPEAKENQKLFMSKTTGFPLVNQASTTNRVFIELLSEFAYSDNYKTSCFYTFVNSRGEFYFMAMEEMMNQKPVFNYEIDLILDMSINDKYIKNYTILHGGMPVNLKNYKKKFYNYSSSGTASSENPIDIHTATNFKTTENEKLLIRKQYIPTSDNTSHDYYGIMDEENGAELYKGFKNGKYKNTNMCYRMIIIVQFSPKLVSGKTVSIKIKKSTKNNEVAQEYAGTWLICESMHLFDRDGEAYSQLTISKPKIAIDSKHPFKGDFSA